MQDTRIVHLCQDKIWAPGAYRLFEKAFPGANHYVALQSNVHDPLKYIGGFKPLTILPFGELIKKRFYLLQKASLVVVHGLIYQHARLVDRLPRHIRVVWLIMGTEMWENPYIYQGPILGDKTRKMKKRINKQLDLTKGLKDVVRRIRFGRGTLQYVAKAAGRIDYVATFQREQYDLLKRLHAIREDTRYLHYAFYPLERIVDKEKQGPPPGSNVLLGNSAAFSNNHLEAIDRLSALDTGDRKIYTPLSYGNHRNAKKVMEYGCDKLGGSFHPLTRVLPLAQYNQILNSCSIVIMNHYRGQAAGNVLSVLYNGSRLYMSEQSTLYQYLKRIGCHVYCVEKDLVPSNPDVFAPLAEEQVVDNRNALKGEISEEVLVKNLYNKLNA